MTMLTHWKKLENPDYIGAYAFQPGEEKVVTVSKVQREVVTGPDGKKEECTIVHFEEAEKPLILNATNGKAIEKLAATPYIEKWVGVRLALGVEKVKAFGETVDAVRVKNKRLPRKEQPIPACTDCKKPIQGTDKLTAQQMISATVSRFSVPLCASCAAARKATMKKEEESHENNENPNQ